MWDDVCLIVAARHSSYHSPRNFSSERPLLTLPQPAFELPPYALDPRFADVISPRYAPAHDPRGWFASPPSRSLPSLSPRYAPTSLYDDPEIRKAYDRIKDRQRKLEALRRGADIDDNSDVTSGGSDATATGDRKSVTSAYSYTQGYYRPDVMALFEGERASRSDARVEDAAATNDAAGWIRRQEEEIAARCETVAKVSKNRVVAQCFVPRFRQKALEDFIRRSNQSQASLQSGPVARQPRSRTPAPTRAAGKPQARQRASSEPRARRKSRDRSARRKPEREERVSAHGHLN